MKVPVELHWQSSPTTDVGKWNSIATILADTILNIQVHCVNIKFYEFYFCREEGFCATQIRCVLWWAAILFSFLSVFFPCEMYWPWTWRGTPSSRIERKREMKSLARGHRAFGGRVRSCLINSRAGAGQLTKFENAKVNQNFKKKKEFPCDLIRSAYNIFVWVYVYVLFLCK